MTEQGNIKIYDYGKIDIHNRKHSFETALNQLKANRTIDEQNENSILNFIRDCLLGKTVKGKSKKKIGTSTCLKYIHLLKLISIQLSKPFNEITLSDMEDFIQKLEGDNIVSKSGKPYSESTKIGIKKTIKKFWKWKDGNSKAYPELVEWIDTCLAVKDVPALRREEVERMIECTPNPRNKALIMVLFDSGARIEELLNVRLKPEHLFWKSELLYDSIGI
jgi:integrase